MRKKRVLLINEASFLATGFSTYGNEVLKRLYATNEFELFELGAYAEDGDQRINSIPWKFYAAAPNKNDEEGRKIYGSDPINQFGKMRFNSVCLDCKPDICVPPGTKIETSDGIRNIEEIAVNDYVISHLGRTRKVLKTMKNQHIGELIKIYPYNDNQSYNFTPNHPVLIIQSKKRTWKERDTRQRHFIKDAKFIEASALNTGDYVLIPIYQPNKNPKTIDVTEYLDNFIEDNNFIYPHGHKNYKKDTAIPKIINVDQRLAKLLGYYCAEGSSGGQGSIQFAFNINEKEYHNEVLSIMKEIFNINGTINKDKNKNGCSVAFCSVLVKQLFGKWCGIGSHNKKVPNFIYNNNDKEICESFLEALIKGDGCYKTSTVSLATVSELMARQVRQIFARLKCKASIQKIKIHPNTLCQTEDRYFFEVSCYGEFAELAHTFINKKEKIISKNKQGYANKNNGGIGWIEGNYIIVPIRRIRKES